MSFVVTEYQSDIALSTSLLKYFSYKFTDSLSLKSKGILKYLYFQNTFSPLAKDEEYQILIENFKM